MRETYGGLQEVHAECLTCGWSSYAKNARGNAARHHDATGHVVTGHEIRGFRYGGGADITDAIDAASKRESGASG